MASWSSNSGNTASTVSVTLQVTSCDCSALAWTAPSISKVNVNIDASDTPSVPVPSSDTSARSTNFAFDQCYQDGGTCATTGAYSASSDFTFDDGTGATTLPSWITWNTGTQTLTVNPTTPSLAGTTYTIAATYSPDASGSTASSFTVLEITVKCVVTSFTRPSNPSSGTTQYVKGSAIEFDFNNDYVQSPACGYAYSNSFTWTGVSGNSFMSTDASGVLSVQAFDTSLAGDTYTVSV